VVAGGGLSRCLPAASVQSDAAAEPAASPTQWCACLSASDALGGSLLWWASAAAGRWRARAPAAVGRQPAGGAAEVAAAAGLPPAEPALPLAAAAGQPGPLEPRFGGSAAVPAPASDQQGWLPRTEPGAPAVPAWHVAASASGGVRGSGGVPAGGLDDARALEPGAAYATSRLPTVSSHAELQAAVSVLRREQEQVGRRPEGIRLWEQGLGGRRRGACALQECVVSALGDVGPFEVGGAMVRSPVAAPRTAWGSRLRSAETRVLAPTGERGRRRRVAGCRQQRACGSRGCARRRQQKLEEAGTSARRRRAGRADRGCRRRAVLDADGRTGSTRTADVAHRCRRSAANVGCCRCSHGRWSIHHGL
jgi:hypothetical protein